MTNDNVIIVEKYGAYSQYIEDCDYEDIREIVKSVNVLYTFLPEFLLGHACMGKSHKDTMELINNFNEFYGGILNNDKNECEIYCFFKLHYVCDGCIQSVNCLVIKNNIDEETDKFDIEFYILSYIQLEDFKDFLINVISQTVLEPTIYDDGNTELDSLYINYMTDLYYKDNEEITNAVKKIIKEGM